MSEEREAMPVDELGRRLVRDAVGCLHGGFSALIQDGEMSYPQRMEMADLLRRLTDFMTDIGGPDQYGDETSLSERQEGTEEVISEIREG
jgi:hypothetical protein